MVLLLLILSICLFLSHSIFFFRAIFYRNRDFTPKRIDRVSKFSSILLLIPTSVIASKVFNQWLSIFVWMPVVLIIISNFNKPIIRKYPYLLPLINLVSFLILLLLAVREVLSL